MNKSDLLEKIKSLLNRMRDHDTPDNVTSKEELGPLLRDAEELLETVSILKFLIEEEVEQPEELVTPTAALSPEPSEEVETPSVAVVEPITESIPESEPSAAAIEQPKQNEGIEERPDDNSETVSDSEPTATINEKVDSSAEQTRVADRLEKEAIADLQSAIGLNERFLFINELFDGDEEAYKNAINHLNAFTHLEEAMQYVRAEISDKFHWDQEQESTISFYALIEKRHAN